VKKLLNFEKKLNYFPPHLDLDFDSISIFKLVIFFYNSNRF
jgi:hypothetical protein